MQDAATFTEDFLQPLFQPIVALSVREKGGRGEGVRLSCLKKGVRATIHSIHGNIEELKHLLKSTNLLSFFLRKQVF